MNLSISQYAASPADTVLDFLDHAAAEGYSAVAIVERALDEMSAERLAEAIAARGLTVSSLNSAGYFLQADEAARRRQEWKNRRLLEAAPVLGAPLNLIPGGPGPGGLSVERARAEIDAAIEAFAGAARDLGARLTLEPIHPMDLAYKGAICQLAHAEAVCARVPGLAITLDLFHSWWDHDLDRVLAAPGGLAVLQVCDVACPEGAPPMRRPLGEGMMDLARILRLAEAGGWADVYEVELFHHQLDGRPLRQVMVESREAFARLAAAASDVRSVPSERAAG
ncbi:sugar phosphate isomerase/epimerase [Acuticoccus sp. M5D2P5]|uniref:sugar phosphate isomerase/epimerase family protein n=1 Tax=Acuticoccus kalidii TaxID=2910977 RepID=UPI001F2310E5|nr:TIM barrel protein [Acuticoccus kalidii]MCF3934498.1 sugar phosphate isomerase/epimerase [Acuticoccus kalidii]